MSKTCPCFGVADYYVNDHSATYSYNVAGSMDCDSPL